MVNKGTRENWIADTQPADINISGLIRLNCMSPTSLKVTLYSAFRLLPHPLFFFKCYSLNLKLCGKARGDTGKDKLHTMEFWRIL